MRKILKKIALLCVVALNLSCSEQDAIKEDVQVLAKHLYEFSVIMLKKEGEFAPIGAALDTNFEIKSYEVAATNPNSDENELVQLLTDQFIKEASEGKIYASALVYNIVATSPITGEKSDAIAIVADHYLGYSAAIIYPYEISTSGLVFGDTWVQEDAVQVFKKET